ncbi:bifunctional serine/threonine-protein kinase/formylglycine-generating enzyme family protein [Alteromonas hispanica]|uniref:non-specific serine/threonine protein kinase n=1 Tax=Alteromonas hispanica TaxID=315421 RepID=A0A6L9MTJ0_9ALTE|nr:bifunctional serine/threonine-protein kinase/formylglycine-generating enzyme family protein [Alteromonas hispanica]NDW21191.1 SUMF1/EgtB/PvdO family nonheme iron enzyme [Alteromonas hispanica]
MQTGTQIGKYVIGKKLGAGGMADVYLATDSVMGRDVALKVLPPEFARDAERIHRFQKEVQASAALSHPNIIPVYDVGEAQVEGFTYHYYTMALLPGGDLKQRIEQGLTAEQSLSTIKAIAEALGYAHDKGLVHRDIKPENILFDESDRPILTDLGIAKAINSGTKMTGTGMSIGTPHYMSPEQAKGESDLDGRSDIYALGIMLFEMLTGQVPYQGDNTMAVGIMHIQNPLPKLPQYLNQYQGLLDNCLAKNKANRYQNARGLIQDVDKLLQGQTLRASQKTRIVQGAYTHHPSSNHQGLKWGIGGALIATLLVAGVYIYQQNISSKGYSSPSSQQAQTPIVSQTNVASSQPISSPKSEAELARARLAELAISRKLDELAKAAEADITALRLTRPEGNNALDKIIQIQVLEPDNKSATALKDELLSKLRTLTISAISKNEFDKAKGYITTINEIQPGYSRSSGLNDTLVQEQQSYERLLKKAADEKRKREQERQIKNYQRKVEQAIARNQFVLAKEYLNEANKISSDFQGKRQLEQMLSDAEYAYNNYERYVGKLIDIPAGNFAMGCSDGDMACNESEKPRINISIDSFKLMESEVTFSMWDLCVQARGCYQRPSDEGWGLNENPVVNVNYSDIVEQYIPWLRKVTRRNFYLPTEAQWEYAARAGSKWKFGWGKEFSEDKANCSECGSKWDNLQPAPVKSFAPNTWGLFDMQGNVWEWTSSCWKNDLSDWSVAKRVVDQCKKVVVRGGSYGSSKRGISLSFRNGISVNLKSSTIGFRLASDND